MSAKYEELVKAGAPRLPEGYYYKIDTKSVLGAEVTYVDVYRGRQGLRDRRRARSSAWTGAIDGVNYLAVMCQESYQDAFPPRAAGTWLDDFIGRHP